AGSRRPARARAPIPDSHRSALGTNRARAAGAPRLKAPDRARGTPAIPTTLQAAPSESGRGYETVTARTNRARPTPPAAPNARAAVARAVPRLRSRARSATARA